MKNGGLKAVMCIDFQGFCMQQSTIMNFSLVIIYRHDYSSVALNVSIVCVGFTAFLARSQFIPAALSAMGGKKFSLGRVRKSTSSSSNGRRKVSGRPPKGRKQTKVSLPLAVSKCGKFVQASIPQPCNSSLHAFFRREMPI